MTNRSSSKKNEGHEGEEKFEELRVENFPYLKKDTSPQILGVVPSVDTMEYKGYKGKKFLGDSRYSNTLSVKERFLLLTTGTRRWE